MNTRTKPLIGISACLLGENVRHNGGNTRDKWITTTLSQYVDFYPMCPEFEMGLGVPRDEIKLVMDKNKNVNLVSKKSGISLTQKAHETYNLMNKSIKERNLDGFILMKKSPSCGLRNAKVYKEETGDFIKPSHGLFAQNLEINFPNTPKVDSGRFMDIRFREHFIKSVFAYHRLNQSEKTISALQSFHKKYKYILMEHNQNALRALGQTVANHDNRDPFLIHQEYKELFFNTLNQEATPKNRYNTLLHVLGYLKNFLSSEDKKTVLSLLDDYKNGIQNYMTPLSLLHFFISKYKIDYFKGHFYFNPYPKELLIHKEL